MCQSTALAEGCGQVVKAGEVAGKAWRTAATEAETTQAMPRACRGDGTSCKITKPRLAAMAGSRLIRMLKHRVPSLRSAASSIRQVSSGASTARPAEPATTVTLIDAQAEEFTAHAALSFAWVSPVSAS